MIPSPVATPTATGSGRPPSAIPRARRTMSAAVSRALTAWSSRDSGAPHTAITPSPMNLSTMPPVAKTAWVISS